MILKRLHWAVAGCGVALLAAGVVGAARSWASRGLMTIFAAGLICLLLALVAHRLEEVRVEHGSDGTKIGFTLSRMDDLSPAVVGELKETGLTGAAATYAFVHNQLADDPASTEVKVRLQDKLVALVKENAFAEPINAERVEQVLISGSPAERVLAFGLLQSDPQMATVDLLRKGIEQSRSGNEQYHALLATRARWPTLSGAERDQLRRSIREAPYIAEDLDRAEIARDLLNENGKGNGNGGAGQARPDPGRGV